MEMRIDEAIGFLSAQQQAAERLIATLLLWLAVLSAVAGLLLWAWLTGTSYENSWIPQALPKLYSFAGFAGLGGCVAAPFVLWRVAHTVTRKASTYAFSKHLKSTRM